MIVMGAFSAGTVVVASSAGGAPGCSGACSAANGPGHGLSGAGGGGAGYATKGTDGAAGTGGVAYGDPSVIHLPGGSGGGNGTVAGGNGGGVLRVLAGSLTLGTVTANGAAGNPVGGINLSDNGAGGGSGGTLLLQSRAGLTITAAHADPGAGSAGGTLGAAGGAGAPGRIRIDLAKPQVLGGTVTPAVGYLGAMIAHDFATAQKASSLTSVQVVCGLSTRVQILVDDQVDSAVITCDATTAPSGKAVSLTTPVVADGRIHHLCVQSLPSSGSPVPLFVSTPFAEDRNCRAIVLVP
jgi:hypothetical protein